MAEDLEDKIADVQKSVEKLASQVSKLAGKKLRDGLEEGEEMMDTAKAGVKKAVKMGQEKTDELNEMVADNPWLAVAVVALGALAIGHVLGSASRKE